MSFTIHTEIEGIPEELPIPYFQKAYHQSQTYSQFVAYSDDNFFISLDLHQKKAISIPRSPFGSIIRRNNNDNGYEKFLGSVISDLLTRDIHELVIHHASEIYDEMIPRVLIEASGFQIGYTDINQHIELIPDWKNSIHNMQKRKLELLKKEGFEFRKMNSDEFETAHRFLTVCRQAQGLQINISWEQLKSLMHRLPDVYDCFGVFRDGKISALCISVKVTSNVAYYYLPATSPMFRDKSPMVLLIAGMVNHYRSEGFKYLDLGISSSLGNPQETLRIFKERMGAFETSKPTFFKSL